MFILGNQFLLPADKAENEDLVGEGDSGAQSFLPVCRFWHLLSTESLVMIRSRVWVPRRAAPLAPLYKSALVAPSSVIAELSGGSVSRSHSSYFADS